MNARRTFFGKTHKKLGGNVIISAIRPLYLESIDWSASAIRSCDNLIGSPTKISYYKKQFSQCLYNIMLKEPLQRTVFVYRKYIVLSRVAHTLYTIKSKIILGTLYIRTYLMEWIIGYRKRNPFTRVNDSNIIFFLFHVPTVFHNITTLHEIYIPI